MLIGYILLVITTFLFYRVVRQTLFVDVTIEKNIGFDKWISEQRSRSFEIILKNIHPPGTPRGFLAASLTTFHPNYYYTWTRDAALVIQDISSLPETEDSVLRDYVDFQVYSQNVPTVCDCLGEPKFNPDGTAFSGAWGRPQNDGPAARAITFMSIIDRFTGKYDGYISKTLLPALEKDLDYVTQVWEEPCYDLWEEVDGVHFYTLMAMRKALLDGYKFIDKDEYVYTAKNIQDRLSTFWSPKKNYVRVTQNTQGGVNKSSGLDVSVLLAANKFSDIDDGFFSPASDKILATAAALRASFITVYPINGNLQPDLGTSIGRYPEDVYDGYETTEGNPWFLATAAYAELYYLIIEEWKQHGVTINSVNKEFFKDVVDLEYGDYVPNSNLFEQIISNVSSEADRFLSTIRYYQQTNGSMSEQFNRYTGNMQGARDLTWSHAAFISATDARDIAFSN